MVKLFNIGEKIIKKSFRLKLKIIKTFGHILGIIEKPLVSMN
jgi:hypothetical protein